MKALVIYDQTGKVYLITYGATDVPQGIPCMWVDIPDGAVLERIDVTDSSNPQPVLSYLPETDIGKLQNKVTKLEERHLADSVELEAITEAIVDNDYRITALELGL